MSLADHLEGGLEEFVGGVPGDFELDFGCGDGELVEFLEDEEGEWIDA